MAQTCTNTLDEWAAEERLRTVIMDGVKKVSVIDVICASKGCSAATARSTYKRLVGDKQIGPFSCVADCHAHNIPVASAEEVIQLLHALPGDTVFKRNAANILVRYLGGDPTLTDEVIENRAAQERLSTEAPDHPVRLFGAAVENGEVLPRGAMSSALEGVQKAIDNLRGEVQQTHVWSFSNTSKGQISGRELAKVGHILGGQELRQVDLDERVIKVVDWLSPRFAKKVWQAHGRKIKSIFCVELKRTKMDECAREGRSPFVVFNQGEYRIVYTEADDELMDTVLQSLMPRLENMIGRDNLVATRPRKQRRISEFFGSSASD
jgi:hypothetical protein